MTYEELKFESDDLLNRKNLVINIMNIINNKSHLLKENKSLVLAIDSPWGTGKSYLVNMWNKWLLDNKENNKNCCSVYYNAWENDDWKEAFSPLVYQLMKLDKTYKDDELAKSIVEKLKELCKSCGVGIMKNAIKKHFGEEVSDIFCDGLDSAYEKDVDSFFEKYNNYKEAKEEFKKGLKKLIPKDGKLIVFIDELDRCRPNFAVETLEVVKHYFDIENIVFIFSVDVEQLSHSISTMYGVGMDSVGYLRRFFDFNMKLPTPNIKTYIGNIFKSVIDDSQLPIEMIEKLKHMYTSLNLSLRDINKITNNFLVFYLFYNEYLNKDKVTFDIIERRIFIYLYFMIIKYKYPQIYNIILKERFHIRYYEWDEGLYEKEVDEESILIESKFLGDCGFARGALINLAKYGPWDQFNEEHLEIGFMNINNSGTIAEHIEQTIEMFS